MKRKQFKSKLLLELSTTNNNNIVGDIHSYGKNV